MKLGNSVDEIVKCLEIRKRRKILANISDIFQQESDGALDYINMMKHFPDHKCPWKQKAVLLICTNICTTDNNFLRNIVTH